jgi:flagellar biosynthesis/type III secretory pathway protein FliH
MTVVRTFVPNMAPAENTHVEELVAPQLTRLLHQLSIDERKQLLLDTFSNEIDSIVKQSTDVSVADVVAQAKAEQQRLLEELQLQHATQLADMQQRWQTLLASFKLDRQAIHLVQEDDIVAIVAEATYRVLTEHLTAEAHLQRIVRQAAKEYAADKSACLFLSAADYALVEAVALPKGLEIDTDPALEPGDFQLRLGSAVIRYDLADRLTALNTALLSARAKANV